MNALSPFYYGQKEIRTVKIGDEIWFAGKDICEGLDIAWTSRTLDPIKSDWKRVMNLITPRGNQDLTVIDEKEEEASPSTASKHKNPARTQARY